MIKDKHTKAPWAIGYSDGSGVEYIVAGGDKAVAALEWGCSCCKKDISSFSDLTPEQRANAHLLASAPLMLKTLTNALKKIQSGQEADEKEITFALIKARGLDALI